MNLAGIWVLKANPLPLLVLLSLLLELRKRVLNTVLSLDGTNSRDVKLL